MDYPDWEEKKLGNTIGYFIVEEGHHDTRIQKYWRGSIPWISSSDNLVMTI